MYNTNIILSVVVILMTFGLCSCSKPNTEEIYAKSSDRDDYGRYEFVLDMSDSSALGYGVDLLIPMECSDNIFEGFENMSLNMMWESPGQTFFEENVWLSGNDLSASYRYSKLFMVRYRSGILPYDYGQWKLYISVPEEFVNRYKIPGIGVRLVREI